MFCKSRCKTYLNKEQYYASCFLGHTRIDFDIRKHSRGHLVCPPIDCAEALAGTRVSPIRDTILSSPGTSPSVDAAEFLDAVCAAHLIDADTPSFAIDLVVFVNPKDTIRVGSRLAGPAAWRDVLIVTKIASYPTSELVILETATAARRSIVFLQLNTHQHGSSIAHPSRCEGTVIPNVSAVDSAASSLRAVPTPMDAERPKATWANLIADAIEHSAKQELSLTGIYEALCRQYPWFTMNRSKNEFHKYGDCGVNWTVDRSRGRGRDRPSRAKRVKEGIRTEKDLVTNASQSEKPSRTSPTTAESEVQCFEIVEAAGRARRALGRCGRAPRSVEQESNVRIR
ncbi:hypothetical protein B0H13DRAFT_1929840 [Mycena leptocephala]|nr:hypothetical protein B0H13DRAFT_1929840 [Mycena leptocephala]